MKLVVAGVLHNDTREVRLRAEYPGGDAQIKRVERSLKRFERVIASIADVAKIRHSDTHSLREERHQVGIDDQIAGADAPVDESI